MEITAFLALLIQGGTIPGEEQPYINMLVKSLCEW